MDVPTFSPTELLTLVRFVMLYPYAGKDVSGVDLKRVAYEMKQADSGFAVADVYVALKNALSFWVTLKHPMVPHPYDFIRYEMKLFLPKKV